MHYAKIQTFQKHFRSDFVCMTCVYDLRNLLVLWTTNNPHHIATPFSLVSSFHMKNILMKSFTMFLTYITYIWTKKIKQSEENAVSGTCDIPCFHIFPSNCLPKICSHHFIYCQENFELLLKMPSMLLLLL